MAPLHGWGPRGRRVRGHAPHGHWRTQTFLAALRQDALTAPCVFDGPINGRAFLAWVERLLVPTLRPGDVVVLDNLGSHKGAAVRRAVEAAGAPLVPSTLQPRSQSDRTGLLEGEALAARGPGQNIGGSYRQTPPDHRPLSATRMRKLPRNHRIRFQANVKRSSSLLAHHGVTRRKRPSSLRNGRERMVPRRSHQGTWRRASIPARLFNRSQPNRDRLCQVKALVRSAAARCANTLNAALKSALAAFSPNECSNYVRHAG